MQIAQLQFIQVKMDAKNIQNYTIIYSLQGVFAKKKHLLSMIYLYIKHLGMSSTINEIATAHNIMLNTTTCCPLFDVSSLFERLNFRVVIGLVKWCK